jgi:hypothetical protein
LKPLRLSLSLCFLAISALGQSPNVLTRQNDNNRTGRQLDETVLTQTAVHTANNFGKVFKYSVTGQIYAQPLAVTGIFVTCSQDPHCNVALPADVIYVATEDDWLYAFDATGVRTTPYWSVNLATNAVPNIGTYVTCSQIFSQCSSTSAIYPDIGVTGTPVIDINTDTLYVVSAVSSTSGGITTIADYLHAIDITDGDEQFGGPKLISASYSGAASMPGACQTGSGPGTINFAAINQLQRPGLLLLGTADGLNTSVVYAGFSIYDGNPSFYGWVLGYAVNNQQLQQVAVFLTTPFGTGGAFGRAGPG